MKVIFVRFVLMAFPSFRRLIWRIGRKMYMVARLEMSNISDQNGEYWLLEQVIKKQNGQNSVLIDIGANRGDWTQAACHCLANDKTVGKIFSFEPSQVTHRFLLNRFKNFPVVHTFELAMSNKSGERDFYIIDEMAGVNSLVKSENGAVQKVHVTTIDEFIKKEKIDHVLIVKSDTEGHDFSVIQGAEEALTKGQIDLWQFEYNHRWVQQGSNLIDVFKFISDKPYQLGKLYGNGIELYEQWHPELERYFEVNFVLMKKGNPLERISRRVCFDKFNIPVHF